MAGLIAWWQQLALAFIPSTLSFPTQNKQTNNKPSHHHNFRGASGLRNSHRQGTAEEADAPASIEIIERYLKLNPNGSAYVYAPWPGIPAVGDFTKRVREEAMQSALAKGEDREEVVKKIKVVEPNHDELEPLRNSFDYAARWLAPYDQSKGNPVGDDNAHTRAHQWDTMEVLKAKFPDLWNSGRLGMIPVGDVFLEIDARMRVGKGPGLINVGSFSTDGGHLRSGLLRYVLGATHYAVLFKAHPKEVDWKIYQDVSNYESKKHGFFVFQPDLGKHLAITPEIAAEINDEIWKVASEPPYTHISTKKN